LSSLVDEGENSQESIVDIIIFINKLYKYYNILDQFKYWLELNSKNNITELS
jgi:hypothetical protein